MRPIRYSSFLKQVTLIKIRLSTLETQVSASAVSESISEAEIAKLKTIDETAIRKNNEFEALLNKLFSSDPLPEDIKDEEVSKLQEEISDLYIKIHSQCSTLVPTADPRLDQSHSSTQSSALESVGVRLPTLNLGIFSGQADKWIAFHSLFESTVHKSSKLSEVEKFTYLLSCLTGEPLNLIKSLPITVANYHIAYQLLIKRYNNSRLLITLHINNILDLPILHNSSVKQLRIFISSLQENISALRALQHDIGQESLFMTTYLLRKFDNDLRSKFEHSRADSQQMPTVQELIDFVEKECAQLEAANLAVVCHKPTPSTSIQRGYSHNTMAAKPSRGPFMPRTALLTASSNQTCVFCALSDHTVYRCDGFSRLTPSERLKYIQNNSLCNNCLGRHSVRNCMSTRSCNVCHKRHHSLLHLNTSINQQSPSTSYSNDKKPIQKSRTYSQLSCKQHNEGHKNSAPMHSVQLDQSQENNFAHKESSANATALVGLSRINDHVVLLGTALVHLSMPNGNSMVARAVLDSAAQQSFVSESCARSLGITQSSLHGQKILGISSATVPTKGLCHLNISTVRGHVIAENHPVIILDNITTNLPYCRISKDVKERTHNLVLADPTFDTPAPIDLLIGADLFASTLKGESSLSLGENLPTALNTVFGYVLIGSTPVIKDHTIESSSFNLLTTTDFDLHSVVQKFWSLESVPEATMLSPAEKECEEHFKKTHTRLNDGKYQVRLPLMRNPATLGDSSKTAFSRFKSLEHRLSSDLDLNEKYVEFMQDYHNSGHMIPITHNTLPPEIPKYYIPHHGVLRENKIRVVFNASALTSTGISLNGIMHQGPKLQNEIPDIILNFRRHGIVFTCDIRQMFRNIWIHPEDQNLQLILWRKQPGDPLQVYKLTTVTYGMSSSPFLANRVIQQLIQDERCSHPLAAAALEGQIYVDDCLLGAASLEEALLLQQDVIHLMKKGGFSLRKWSSNHSKILEAVPEDHRGTPIHFQSSDQPLCSILGLKWLSEVDFFSYLVITPKDAFTKRTVLSTIAQLYDPMGWLSPTVFWAKSFMQLLWTKGLQWDDPLPSDLIPQWSQFVQELHMLEQIRIPRHVNTDSASTIQIHGFCDASEAGFCASVFLRALHKDYTASVYLLIAKTRVAPLKRVSLPRLELCGAHMLSKLLQYCYNLLSKNMSIDQVFAWSDATIVLSWIQTPAYRLKTYVANRIAQIQDIGFPVTWSHVPSQQNPADCGSRGLLPSLLIIHPIWWHGPQWLKAPPSHWPSSSVALMPEEMLPDIKPSTITTLTATEATDFDLLQKYSSWMKLIRITAYLMRFIQNCRNKTASNYNINSKGSSNSKPTSVSPLTIIEINNATNRILTIVQQESFSNDSQALQKKLMPSTNIRRLSPFYDEDINLIRVGGRLSNSSLDYHAKHPILLPKHHFVTDLIIDYYHVRYLHCGPQMLQSLISQKYWILSARSKIRNRVFRCLRCYRCKPKKNSPFMADLPATRVSPTRAFETSAVDFAGPFQVKLHNLRRLQHIKVYLCLFICMSTKAVHLEVVTDLTSDAFIASLTRFISRRGIVKHLHSDNATNFVGAVRHIRKIINDIMQKDVTQRYLTENGISFHFIPPRAPHFGGLWERAIQSAKCHLRRVVGEQILSLEELTTLTCRIEAMLNSRPITPLSSDPTELEALTPGHFLTGGPPVILPERDHLHVNPNRLKRWQLVQSFAQHIWKRWQRDYLYTLQCRSKWTKPQQNLKIGHLVILQEDNIPPLQWRMGRISQLFPGKDGVARVAEVKTAAGCFRRPVSKLSPLPFD